jgi:hypothetical protein
VTGPPTLALRPQPPVDRKSGAADDLLDPVAVVAAARRRQRRRRARLAALGLAAFVLGAGLWLTIGSRGKGLAVAEIDARELAALHSRAAGLILFEQKQPELRNFPDFPPGFSVSRCMGCGLTDTWINLETGRRRDLYYSPGGRLVGQNTESLLPSRVFYSGQVNYKTRTWYESSIPLRSAKTRRQIANALAPLKEANLPPIGSDSGWTFKLIGRQTIGGQLTLHLRGTPAKPAQPAQPAATRAKPGSGNNHSNGVYFAVTPTRGQGRPMFDVWLNARTYLPARAQVRGPSGGVQSTTTYQWLPRNSANLAKLKLDVPAGFGDQLAARRHPSATR